MEQMIMFMNSITTNSRTFSVKKLNRIRRIDETVREYFENHPDEYEIPARSLMPLFISKGIFVDDVCRGLHIRNLLRELYRTEQLYLFKSVMVIRNKLNSNWYFRRK